MAIIGDTLPHCTGTGTQADPYIFTTELGFLEAIDVVGSYVEAGLDNLQFDCNEGIITPPINVKCINLKGRGLTILNAVVQNKAKYILNIYYDNLSVILEGLNLYNFAILVDNLDTGIIRTIASPDAIRPPATTHINDIISNCNFAGLFRGSKSGKKGLFTTDSTGSTNLRRSILFKNCTFNINFRVLGTTYVFGKYSSGETPILKDCTVSFSGQVSSTLELSDASMYLSGTTFMNKQSNPLEGNGSAYFNTIGQDSSYSGYNYFKMYVSTTNFYGKSDDNSKTLWNTSRITSATQQWRGTPLKMQEDDPLANDYIYSSENLEQKGFLIGTVIE